VRHIHTTLARLAAVLTRRRADARLDEEIQSHLDALVDEYEHRGLSPDDARRAARRAFGGVVQMKEAHREQRAFFATGMFDALARDCRRTMRRLLATPGPTLFSIATLAVAIGVTTATYSVLIAMFGDISRDIRHPDSLVSLAYSGGVRAASASPADYRDLREQQHSLTGLAASAMFSTSLVTRGSSSLVVGELVDGAYFSTAGVPVRVGRAIGPDDDRADAPPVVMISDVTWRTRFGRDPSVVGSQITLAGRPFTVIGVGPPGFAGLLAVSIGANMGAACWVPLTHADAVVRRLGPAVVPQLQVIGRLKTAVTVRQAAEDFGLIGRRLDRDRPLTSGVAIVAAGVPRNSASAFAPTRNWSAVSTFGQRQTTQARQMRRVLLALPVLVLLVACTNLANLALSRGLSRRRTFAIRRALGASRARVVREEMIEGAIVAVTGGIAALAVARLLIAAAVGAVRGPIAVLLSPIVSLDFRLEPIVLLFAAGATVLALVVGTLAPALQLSRTSVAHALGRDVDTATPRWRGRRNLIALQVGASVGLFLVAFASMTFVQRTAAITRGPSLDRVAAAGIPFEQQQYDETRARETLDRAVIEVRRVPGVTAAGLVAGLRGATPGAFRTYSRYAVSTMDQTITDAAEGLAVDATIASPDIFHMVPLPITSGRAFDGTDTASSERVAIVNESLARAWPESMAGPGRLLYIRRQSPFDPTTISTARIVGVVADGGDPARRADARIYLPFTQAYESNVMVLAEAAGGSALPVDDLRAALRRIDPDLAPQFVVPGAMVMDALPRLLRSMAVATSSLAALALLFAMTGLYGVLSHLVARRTREMAIRAALGADRRTIAKMVLKDGLRPVAEGLVIGLGVATIIRTIMQMTVARGLSSIDTVAFGLAAMVLIAAALVACWLPARRATKVDPNVALRDL
jgi:putative ABC transport system permease protein